ncbi:transketolase [Thermocatellispora tengchongensis]|uniref:Transketolase n=1 Tax=Thermocatellispora tengchongensis TaxID=1073253 RepID=A0A840P8L8_9ACTN|nr:transketolase [Thermocatellispora tengchongensis]MBB5132345.1 transketolase [Thermocatellispora tengchongensis]
MPDPDLHFLGELAAQLRVDAIRASAAAGSGHPTSSLSAADLMAVLFACHLRYDFDDPGAVGNDHLIFSKGHASPLLYALYKAAGAITDEELLTFRKHGSRLEGHPTPRLPWVDVGTGSLGQGLPVGVGIALAGRRLDRVPYHVWVLCGDSELAEGSIWEAAEHAGYEGLANLTAIVDVNRLGQRGPTRHGWDTGAYARRLCAFGWHTIEIDGHDPGQIDYALQDARVTRGRPTAILARTRKGEGVSDVENREGKHGKPLADPDRAVEELGGPRSLRVRVAKPEAVTRASGAASEPLRLPAFPVGERIATRTAYGEALVALGAARRDVVALDGEVADSTKTETFAESFPDRFFECYIAEQQMVAAAVGMQVRGWTPYAATFAAFFTRAYDFVRMAAVSRADIRLVGSHAGVSIGEDGPSQMGLEDIAMMRAVHGSTVLYPCDANQTAKLVVEMAGRDGVSYLRTTRGATPVIYGPDEEFPIGGCRVLRRSHEDLATIVTAGITVHEALAAAEALEAEGIMAGVVDLYSIKPLDVHALREAATTTGNMITVEDHWAEGGLGEAVLSAVADLGPRVVQLAVRSMPGSATPEEQLRDAGIDRTAIAEAVRRLKWRA